MDHKFEHTFILGCKDPMRRVDCSGSLVDDRVVQLLRGFTPLEDGEKYVRTIVLTPRRLGLVGPTTEELFNPLRLAEWSKKNDCMIELLPAFAGPDIRWQYRQQPKGERLWIAMAPLEVVTDEGREPSMFRLERTSDGVEWLIAPWVQRKRVWGFDELLLFRLRDA
jgi:hypothetical protein